MPQYYNYKSAQHEWSQLQNKLKSRVGILLLKFHLNGSSGSLAPTPWWSWWWGKISEFKPFPMVLVLYEMQTTSSKIWTWVPVSTFYADIYCAIVALSSQLSL